MCIRDSHLLDPRAEWTRGGDVLERLLARHARRRQEGRVLRMRAAGDENRRRGENPDLTALAGHASSSFRRGGSANRLYAARTVTPPPRACQAFRPPGETVAR